MKLTFSFKEKHGRSILRDHFCEHAEDLFMKWDLNDMIPKNKIFIWSNRRIGLGHVVSRLYHLFVSNSIFLSMIRFYSTILSQTVSLFLCV